MYLLALKGLPGTGKTTLARSLSRNLRWPLVDKDDIKDVLHGHCDSGPLSYEAMFAVAHRQLSLGLDVICDSPLAYLESYANACALAQATGAMLLVLETTLTDYSLWEQRIEQRKSDPAQLAAGHRVVDWATFRERCPRFRAQHLVQYPITTPLLTVDTSTTLPQVLSSIYAWLAEHGVALAGAR